MLTYTIALGDRSADTPDLSDHEAADMARLGFRFAEFRPEGGRYRLSPSYRTLQNFDRGTLTFQQAESEARKLPPAKPTTDDALFEVPAGTTPAGTMPAAPAAPAGAPPARTAGQGR